MATERLDIVIQERGGQVVRKSIDDIGRGAIDAQRNVHLLTRAFQGLVAVLGVRELMQMSDTYTNLQNRLKMVTTGTDNLRAVTRELFNVANDTRTSFEATATLYARIAMATKQFGYSQQELINFTKGVSQAIILSGASAQEANRAMIQFTQGLAKGRLDGDELRSVLEQIPFVADVIAKKLGVARGELRELGKQGKLTPRMIIEAFKDMENNLTDMFAKTLPTFGQAFEVFGNRIMQFVGDMNNALGVNSGIAQALDWIGKNFNVVTAAVMALLPVLGLLLGRVALGGILAIGGSVVSMVGTMTAAFAALGGVVAGTTTIMGAAAIAGRALTTAFAGIVTILGGALIIYGQLDTQFDDVLEGMGLQVNALDRLAATWGATVAFVKAAWANFPEWFENLMSRAMDAALKQFARLADAIPALLLRGADLIGDQFDKIGLPGARGTFADIATGIADQFKTSAEINAQIDSTAKSLLEIPDALGEATNAYNNAYKSILLNRATPLGSLNPGGPNTGKDPLGKAKKGRKEADPYLAGILQDMREEQALKERILKLDNELAREAEFLAATSKERDIQNELLRVEQTLRIPLVGELRDEFEAQIRANAALKEQGDILNSIRDPQIAYRDTLANINALEDAGKLNNTDARRKRLENEKQYYNEFPTIANTYKAALIGITMERDRLTEALAENAIGLETFNMKMMQLGINEAQMRVDQGQGTYFDVLQASMDKFFGNFQTVAQSMTEILGTLWSNMTTGIGDSIGRALVYADNLKEGLLDVARQGVAQVISSLVQMGIQWAVTQALGTALQTASLATTVATASATAAAWAPAAALASLATLGTNAVPAGSAIISTNALAQAFALPGFESGGWTGGGGRSDVAGLVHGQEFVVNADAAARNRPMLEAMNAGGSVSGGMTVNIINQNSGAQFEVRYVTADEVEVIAIRVARKEAPGAVGRDMADRNGPVRQGLAAYTDVRPKQG